MKALSPNHWTARQFTNWCVLQDCPSEFGPAKIKDIALRKEVLAPCRSISPSFSSPVSECMVSKSRYNCPNFPLLEKDCLWNTGVAAWCPPRGVLREDPVSCCQLPSCYCAQHSFSPRQQALSFPLTACPFSAPRWALLVVVVKSLRCVWLFATPWIAAHQAVLHYLLQFAQTHVYSTISSSFTPFPSCPQSFSASGSFPMNLPISNGSAHQVTKVLELQ